MDMDKWEYQVVDFQQRLYKVGGPNFPSADEETKLLNEYGKDGWELVSVTQTLYEARRFHSAYLKRRASQ